MAATQDRYSTAQIVLHWLIVALFAFNYIVSDPIAEAFEAFWEEGAAAARAAGPGLAAQAHVWVGIAVMVLMVVRLGLRSTRGAPPPAGTGWLARAAHLGHLALYGLLLVIPMAGMVAWFQGEETAAEVHGVLVNLALAVIAVHTAAALYHHFVLKDGLLGRMRP
ncbi:MAG: cytochrome b/b6 domain-containing protein [Rhodobacteraceae bacterium]|nr:cytochrome b/b6 domain-containing protein [Paracoccaceae bacterium]